MKNIFYILFLLLLLFQGCEYADVQIYDNEPEFEIYQIIIHENDSCLYRAKGEWQRADQLSILFYSKEKYAIGDKIGFCKIENIEEVENEKK